jgi:hypothetical protein
MGTGGHGRLIFDIRSIPLARYNLYGVQVFVSFW